MKKTSRVGEAVAALALAILFVTPMWRVDLKAPQYPEGLGLRIWINQIQGATPNGLNSINGLNHYIGMQAIEPGQIPELRYMPYIVMGLMLAGVLVAALGRRRLLYAYLAAFLVVALAGLYDFWRWEYDYGHNLDPTAAIRIPGMSYQPPLIGGKQLLNFHATSWPDVGGWAAIVAVAVIMLIAFREWRHARAASRSGAVAGLAVLLACASPAPRPVVYGIDQCAHCHMNIADPRHAAELVTKTGKVLVFDDIGCLAAYLAAGDVAQGAIHSTWAHDYASPGEWVRTADLFLVQSDSLHTPMGSGVVALARAESAESLRAAMGGDRLDWAQVLTRAPRH